MNAASSDSNRRKKPKHLDAASKNYPVTLSRLFIDGMGIAKIKPDAIATILNQHRIPMVFIGDTVVGCHSGQPRSTKDVDLIIHPEAKWEAAVAQIAKRATGAKIRKHPSFIEIYELTDLGESELVDIFNVPNGSYGMTFKNAIALDINSIPVSIPTAEIMIVLKYTAAVNPIRPKVKQMQDWVDIYTIVDGKKTCR